MRTRGNLGEAIDELIAGYSPKDIQRMQWNFSETIRTLGPDYRQQLEESISTHLLGTFLKAGLMHRQGTFGPMKGTVGDNAAQYWLMVASQCRTGDAKTDRIRFLKYLLAGFCMFVLETPGHPAGMPFPGGDTVQCIDGIWYCPVRTKANDVDAALCPFCPAQQTPEIGYLKPPVNAGELKKQEFISNCYEHHHFNG
jgi:uncharacterized protein (UPF0305 family)